MKDGMKKIKRFMDGGKRMIRKDSNGWKKGLWGVKKEDQEWI